MWHPTEAESLHEYSLTTENECGLEKEDATSQEQEGKVKPSKFAKIKLNLSIRAGLGVKETA